MGWDVPLIGGDANSNPDLIKIAGNEAAQGYLMTTPPVPKDLPSEKAQSFLTTYKEKYGDAPGSIWAVLSGDGFLVVAEAIKATESTDPDKIADYLHQNLKDFPGLTGNLSFNEKGDRVGDVYRVYTVDAEGIFVLK